MNSTSPSLSSGSQRSSLAYVGLAATIVVVGFFIRVAAAFYWQNSITGDTPLRFGDSDSYWVMASKIGRGLPYQYGSPDSRMFRAPLYPLFLSPWTLINETGQGPTRTSVLWARGAGCAAGALCIAIIIFLTNRLLRSNFDRRSIHSEFWPSPGFWSGLLAVLYPGAIGMSIFILSESIFCPLILLSLGCVSLGIRAKRNFQWEVAWTWMLLSGALSGAACLARPSWSLWPAVLFCYLAVLMTQPGAVTINANRWKWLVGFLLFCLGIFMVMSPWWARNYRETGKFVPTTLQVGASLYDGWHPGASGSSDEQMEFVNAFIAEQRTEDESQVRAGNQPESTFEWRLDLRLRNAAISWAQENSTDALQLGLVKFRKTWSPLPVAKELGSDTVRWLEAIGYSAIMSFAVIGMWTCRSQIGSWLYVMPCVYFALLHMFFIGSVRYRQPAVLVICVLAGVGCSTIIGWLISKTRKTKPPK